MSGQMVIPPTYLCSEIQAPRISTWNRLSSGGYHNALPLTPPNDIDSAPEDASTGANETVAPKPGETLVIYHPHSQCPRHVIPTMDIHTRLDVSTARKGSLPPHREGASVAVGALPMIEFLSADTCAKMVVTYQFLPQHLSLAHSLMILRKEGVLVVRQRGRINSQRYSARGS